MMYVIIVIHQSLKNIYMFDFILFHCDALLSQRPSTKPIPTYAKINYMMNNSISVV